MKKNNIGKEINKMEEEVDFSKGIKNPYAKKLRKQITININGVVVDYFKKLSEECGIPYQNLINYYLIDCVKNKRKLDMSWK